LDDAFYRLLQEGRTTVDGCSVLRIEYLILFKTTGRSSLAQVAVDFCRCS